MLLESGAHVGDYEIVGPLGTGGMSEVYRARDLKLGREVAIKVLPKDLASDPDKRARFEREAQLLAAISHKNIAVIHGLEHDGEVWYLVLELISGETLAQRLKKGPLDLRRARAIFLQIAEALEAAHTKGIIHRDLKPANVKITDDGTVKLLDFGLGKELATSRAVSQKTATFDGSETSPGLVMGTPGYMSPEQARGQTMAKSTDVWSFGVVLFEALSGVHPFARETIPDMLSAILTDPPPWERLPHNLPSPWRVLLERCLRKSERDRLHDIADVRIELEEAPVEPAKVLPPKTSAQVALARWLVVAAAAVAALSLWSLWRSFGPRELNAGVVRRFVIDLPSTATVSLSGASALAVSPDGSRLVYAARRGDQTQLYQRVLDQLETVPLAGTEGGVGPFFAPDTSALGFFAAGKLKLLAFPGGTPTTLADAPTPRGASWSDASDRTANSIVFSPSSQSGLSVVTTTGGPPQPVTPAESDANTPAHRWPSLLPGGAVALVTLWTRDSMDIASVELATGRISPLVDNGSYARYTPTGHLVFQRGGDLYAAAFDARARRLLSEPVVIVEGIAVDEQTGATFYDFSQDGALFYVDDNSEIDNPASMLLVGSDGSASPIGPPMASIQVPRFSPDGRFIVATVQNDDSSDIWSLHLERGNLTRLTLEGTNGAAIWAPEGDRIAFGSSRNGEHAIYWKPSDGSGVAERLTTPGNAMFPTSFSPDGKTLAYSEIHPESGLDIWTLTLETGEARPLVRTPYSEAGAMFSPDGNYLAFTSDESGRDEVYVRAYPGVEGRWQVSTSSGNEPVWSRNGNELFFRSGTNLMVVDIVTEPSFEPAKPRVLLEAPYDQAGALYANYDVRSDRRDFVMIRSEEEAAANRIHVVLHWLDELTRRVPIP